MPQLSYSDSWEQTFLCGGSDLGAFLRVKLTSGTLSLAAATEQAIGYLTARGAKANMPATVRKVGATSQIGIANEAVSIGTALYAGASGKVTDTKPADGKLVGIAGSAAGADGDQILILPVDSRDHT